MNPIRQFDLIIKIADHGSISQAAKELHLAQPTLSKYVANIESQLGLELFDRTVLPIRLTEAGERYVCAGRKIVDVHRQLEKELDALKSEHQATIVIGCSPTRATYILPQIYTEFRKINTDAKIVVREQTTQQLNECLLRGELDMIISLLADSTRNFERVDLFDEKIQLALPKSFDQRDPIIALRACPIISTGANLRLGRMLADILMSLNVPEPSIEVQSIESALSLVGGGKGIMLVPSYISKYLKNENITYLDLPDSLHATFKGEADRHVCLFYPRERALSSSHRDFITACKRAMKE